jgi:uncharacterized protein YqgC (DUF456 family)
MLYVAVVSFLLLLLLCALLNLASLPGNWIMAGLVTLWVLFGPDNSSSPGVFFFLVFFGLALAGEAVEFLSQIWGAKKYGSSGTSTVMGMIGAIAGAVFFAPFLFGLGAVFGALAGAWAGSFLSERLLEGRPVKESVTAANGALLGRFLGMTAKFGLGVSMLVWTAANIWPA